MEKDGGYILSKREKQVLDLIGQGCEDRTIAKSLGLSHHTVKHHIVHIRKKICSELVIPEVKTRNGLALWWITRKALYETMIELQMLSRAMLIATPAPTPEPRYEVRYPQPVQSPAPSLAH